jgi:alcohol dehydrogenase (cytochrome c)
VPTREHKQLRLALACLALAYSASAEDLFTDDGATSLSAEQLSRGQAAYAQACAMCHGASLEGTQFGPTLEGAAFQDHWRRRTHAAFSEKVRTTMPPGRLGSIGTDVYADIEGYILQANKSAATIRPASTPVAADAQAQSQSRPARQNQGAGMMGPAERRDNDPQYLAAIAARNKKLASLMPVTDAMLDRPAPSDWLMWRRSYDGLGYSPLQRIDRSNVPRLRTAWSWVLPQSRNEITPLVHDGVLFVYSGAAIQALDAASGDLLWQYVRPSSGSPGLAGSQGKGLAIYGSDVFAPTADGHLIALDMRTGHPVWDQEVVPSGSGGPSLNGAPIVVNGVVIVGVSLGVSSPGGCFIVGLDALTGKERWRFHTIARPGQPGGDTWNGAPVEERFGGGVWTAGSYDPQLGLVYFGAGNTYDTATLLVPRSGANAVSSNDALYTDSTVALHPESGALAWYYQHQKRDVWDLDWVFEQSLVTLEVNGRPHKLVVTGGKTAMFDALDAASGKFVFSQDLGVQNLVAAVDPATGDKTVNAALEPRAGTAELLCPNSVGARNWPATALNPQTGILYVPILENCADYTYSPRDAAQTSKGGIDIHFNARARPDQDGNFGRLVAVDLRNRRILWTHRQRIPFASATLATAGDLLFAGDVDRRFYAYDQRTGKVLWQTRLDAAPESFPVTFEAEGRQYVAVVVGGGSPFGAASRSYVPEVSSPAAGTTLVVFALDGS